MAGLNQIVGCRRLDLKRRLTGARNTTQLADKIAAIMVIAADRNCVGRQ
jgi:hypothetical protein